MMLAAIAATLLLSGIGGEEKPLGLNPPRVLQASPARLVEVPPFGFYESHCDNHGDMFFHVDSDAYNRSLFLRISHSGRESTIYKLPDEFSENTAFISFALTPSGKFNVLTINRESKIYVFQFEKSGEYKRRIRLEVPDNVSATFLGAFENGRFLLSGYFTGHASQELQGKNFIGLFEVSGKISKRLNSTTPRMDLADIATKLQEGAAVVDVDDKLYLLGSSEISVISQFGQILRRIPFAKPDAAARAVRLYVSEGLLSIVLSKPVMNRPSIVRTLVLNSITGDSYGYYEPSVELGNTCVCFTRANGFTFWRVEKGQVKLIDAPLN